MAELWSHIGITPGGAVGVIIAAAVLYLAYALVLALWGPRLSASSSTLSLALLTVLGSLFARAMLGDFPTLAGAVVASGTLLLLEGVLGRLRRSPMHGPGLHRPRVVIVEGRLAHRTRWAWVVSEADLLTRLRTSGVRRIDDASLVILESRGALTVMGPGERIDERLLRGVVGAEDVPDHLIGRGPAEGRPH